MAVFVVLAVIGVVAAVVSGVVRGDLAEPTSSLPPAGVPDGELVPEDLQAVRFSLGFRGYRMDEVVTVSSRMRAVRPSRVCATYDAVTAPCSSMRDLLRASVAVPTLLEASANVAT